MLLIAYGLDNSLESLRIIHGKVCKHFAVETYVLLGELAHKLRISDTVLTCSGIDSLDPECAEVTLVSLTVTICVCKTFLVGILGYGPNVLPGKEITAGSLENFLAACS